VRYDLSDLYEVKKGIAGDEMSKKKGRWDRRKCTGPTLPRIVKRVYHIKRVRVLLLECIKLLTKEDVFLGDVGEEERELGFVGFVGEGMGYELEERRADKGKSGFAL